MEPLGESEDAAARLAAALRGVAERQDRAAFASVFAFYAPRAKAYFRMLGADDDRAERLAEEAMLAVWRRAEAFARAGVDVRTWVFAQVRDTAVTRLQEEPRPDFDPDDPALVAGPYKAASAGQASGPEPAAGVVTTAIERSTDEEIMLLRTLYQAPLADAARATRPASAPGATRLRLMLDRLRGMLGGAR